ncbi:MAG: pilus assembly protein N-terminal domain-containing protein [Hyphomicrobiales bacterium]|nr:pilus assembly protein N-terminal domain-containing protein [Hyphomicrobiales bacterium]
MRTSTSIALALAALVLAVPAARAKDPISVMIDRAKVMRISAPAATVVIGNPAIADASIQDRQTLVITGKITGVTNLVILDAKGELIADELVNVEKADRGMVTVQRGASRYTYACTPNCNVALEPGDANDFFSQASSQLSGRNGFVTSSSTGATGQ